MLIIPGEGSWVITTRPLPRRFFKYNTGPLPILTKSEDVSVSGPMGMEEIVGLPLEGILTVMSVAVGIRDTLGPATKVFKITFGPVPAETKLEPVPDEVIETGVVEMAEISI